jgi:hypothetical protein
MAEEITMAGVVSTGHKNCIAIVPHLEILQHYPIKEIPVRHPNAYRNIFLAISRKHPLAPCVRQFHDYTLWFAKHRGAEYGNETRSRPTSNTKRGSTGKKR